MPNQNPIRRRIIVDGSNIATEGRSLPSLAQLDEAIRSFLEEYRGFTTADVTVVVDASFGHRIDQSEVATFEEAVLHGEMVTPPAGAVGRGDGFILRIAEKAGALVLSNDSFQEFHAERPWLFDDGRLIGGKPVPGVGWVFTPRTPVRGPKSRAVTSRSRRDARADSAGSEMPLEDGVVFDDEPLTTEALDELSEVAAPPGIGDVAKEPRAAKLAKATKAVKATKATKSVKAVKATKATKSVKAVKVAKAVKATKAVKAVKAVKAAKSTEAVKAVKAVKATKVAKAAKVAKVTRSAGVPAAPPDTAGSSSAKSAPAPLNEPMTFLTFVANHPVGSVFEGTVTSFTSHGAHVDVGAMRCHVPLQGLADPPAIRARDVLTKGETREFVLVSLDAAQRRAELALAGLS